MAGEDRRLVKTPSLADTAGLATGLDSGIFHDPLHFEAPPDTASRDRCSSPLCSAQGWRKNDAAWRAGCRRFDGGIERHGGCPMANDDLVGNLATENILQFIGKSRGNLLLSMQPPLKTAWAWLPPFSGKTISPSTFIVSFAGPWTARLRNRYSPAGTIHPIPGQVVSDWLLFYRTYRERAGRNQVQQARCRIQTVSYLTRPVSGGAWRLLARQRSVHGFGFFLLNEVWHSWDHHSRFFKDGPGMAVQAINQSQEGSSEFCGSPWLIITPGIFVCVIA